MGKTLKEIAKELGLSIGTVDRAIHDRPGINYETKQRVMACIQESGYKANRIGRSLSLRTRGRKIGLILRKAPTFYWDVARKGAAAAAKEYADFGIELLVESTSIERQEQDAFKSLDRLLEQGAEGIALIPSNRESYRRRLLELSESGVAVATVNDDVEGCGRLFYVGPQMRNSGRVAGDLMGRFLGGRGKVLALDNIHSSESRDYFERMAGFEEVMRASFPDIQVVKAVIPFSPLAEYNPNVEPTVLSAGPVDGIYNVDGTSLGILGDIRSNTPYLQNTCVIGHEIWEKVAAHINAGNIDASIHQDPYMQGYIAVKGLVEFLLDGARPRHDKLFTRLDIIMRENCMEGENIINPYIRT